MKGSKNPEPYHYFMVMGKCQVYIRDDSFFKDEELLKGIKMF